jgi:hypothetical protein
MALATVTPKAYYQGTDKGYYQFVSMTDIINNFMVSYIGDDKIIKKAKKAEVSYHAQRSLQELNYDTIDNIKTQEIEIPPSLTLPLPHDFVSYIRITYIDDTGVERPLRPSPVSTAPLAVLQDDDYNYLYDDAGNLLYAKESETLKRFQDSNSSTSSTTTSSDKLEDYDQVDYGKRFGINPETATNNGNFVINQNQGTISFSSVCKDKIITIKYVSDGLNIDGDMKIHKFAEEAIYKCIALGLMSAKSNIPEYQINRLKKEKKAALRSAKLRLANLNMEDLTQVMRGKSKQIKH